MRKKLWWRKGGHLDRLNFKWKIPFPSHFLLIAIISFCLFIYLFSHLDGVKMKGKTLKGERKKNHEQMRLIKIDKMSRPKMLVNKRLLGDISARRGWFNVTIDIQWWLHNNIVFLSFRFVFSYSISLLSLDTCTTCREKAKASVREEKLLPPVENEWIFRDFPWENFPSFFIFFATQRFDFLCHGKIPFFPRPSTLFFNEGIHLRCIWHREYQHMAFICSLNSLGFSTP